MFLRKLYFILEGLNKHKRPREVAMNSFIEERLNKSLESYLHDTEQSIQFLSSRDSLNTLKKFTRL